MVVSPLVLLRRLCGEIDGVPDLSGGHEEMEATWRGVLQGTGHLSETDTGSLLNPPGVLLAKKLIQTIVAYPGA